MTRTRKAPEPPLPQFATRKGTGAAVLLGVDGRSTMARRYREITASIESDLGGDLTEAQRQLVARAATLSIWAEAREAELANGEPFDAAGFATITNTLRRVLCDLGLERRARNVTPRLHDYIAGKAA